MLRGALVMEVSAFHAGTVVRLPASLGRPYHRPRMASSKPRERTHEPSDPLLGRLAGEYRIQRKLGAGGFGTGDLIMDLAFAQKAAGEQRSTVAIASGNSAGAPNAPRTVAQVADLRQLGSLPDASSDDLGSLYLLFDQEDASGVHGSAVAWFTRTGDRELRCLVDLTTFAEDLDAQLVSGGSRTLKAELSPTAQRTTAYALFIAGGAGVLTSAILGGFTLGRDGSARAVLSRKARGNISSEELHDYNDARDERDRLRVFAVLSISLSAAALATALLLFVFDQPELPSSLDRRSPWLRRSLQVGLPTPGHARDLSLDARWRF
jgi:hypothetical protein